MSSETGKLAGVEAFSGTAPQPQPELRVPPLRATWAIVKVQLRPAGVISNGNRQASGSGAALPPLLLEVAIVRQA